MCWYERGLFEDDTITLVKEYHFGSKVMKKGARVGQDVQRVRLLVKKLETFMKTHFVNKLVSSKKTLNM